jgi:hypothetical protein
MAADVSAVVEADADVVGAADDVVVRQQEAIGSEENAGTFAAASRGG